GELEHRRAKRFYRRAHKAHHISQISKLQLRQRKLKKMANRLAKTSNFSVLPERDVDGPPRKKIRLDDNAPPCQEPSAIRFEDDDPLPKTSPDVRYHISNSNRYYIEIRDWLSRRSDDPAYKGFMYHLRNHILMRLNGASELDDLDFTDRDRASIRFEHERLYQHKVLRVNYTTYDMR
ncbi:hypothetical protein K474DRAFT_1569159, partial [Panus rudis PR-1116 ss-1]